MLGALVKTPPLFSLFIKIPLHLISRNSHRIFRTILHFPKPRPTPISMDKRLHLCTLALSNDSHSASAPVVSNKAKKKARRESPEGVLRHKLDMCSRHGHLVEALRLYDEARSKGVPLSLHHYNVLLYLCSSNGGGGGDGDNGDVGLNRGFEIFRQMVDDKVVPNEATFTSAARLAAAAEDSEMAFHLVKQMKGLGVPPKLRSYGPALFGFCMNGEADKAYEVDAHMVESGVNAEETEISALLKVSSDSSKGDKVYEMLHRLRATVRQVSESTCGVVEEWFKSEEAAKVGMESWDVNKVREGVVRGGGGWHGQGWLGTGNWRVVKTQMDEVGTCFCCGQKLVCIDIDPKETANFATSLSKLASQREVRADFVRFQLS